MLNTADHLVHSFDNEIEQLRALTTEMAHCVLTQMDTALQALDFGNMDLAKDVILNDVLIDEFEFKIDTEVVTVLARRSPVANDLRTILSMSKIAVELEKIGNEIADFASLVAYLFGPETSNPNHCLLQEVLKLGNMVKDMLANLLPLLQIIGEAANPNVFHNNQAYQDEFRDGIKQQLDFAVQDARRIGRALTLIKMMKDLEGCGEHCEHIAKHLQIKILQ